MGDLVHVVAAVVEWEGRQLLQQRSPKDSFPFAWCSPGGKVKEGESDEEALAREMREEHGVEVVVGEYLFVHEGDVRRVRFYRATIVGEPKMQVGVGLGWFTSKEMAALEMTPADHAFCSAVWDVNRVWRAIRAHKDLEDGALAIYSEIDHLLRCGYFGTCDLLLGVDVSLVPVVYLLALLSSTLPAGDRLMKRVDFVRRVRERLMREEPERVERLLFGLE